MIPIQIALSILIVLVVGAGLFEFLAGHHDRKADRLDHELTELEVREHVYPDGNVHVLTPNKETAESD